METMRRKTQCPKKNPQRWSDEGNRRDQLVSIWTKQNTVKEYERELYPAMGTEWLRKKEKKSHTKKSHT